MLQHEGRRNKIQESVSKTHKDLIEGDVFQGDTLVTALAITASALSRLKDRYRYSRNRSSTRDRQTMNLGLSIEELSKVIGVDDINTAINLGEAYENLMSALFTNISSYGTLSSGTQRYDIVQPKKKSVRLVRYPIDGQNAPDVLRAGRYRDVLPERLLSTGIYIKNTGKYAIYALDNENHATQTQKFLEFVADTGRIAQECARDVLLQR